ATVCVPASPSLVRLTPAPGDQSSAFGAGGASLRVLWRASRVEVADPVEMTHQAAPRRAHFGLVLEDTPGVLHIDLILGTRAIAQQARGAQRSLAIREKSKEHPVRRV